MSILNPKNVVALHHAEIPSAVALKGPPEAETNPDVAIYTVPEGANAVEACTRRVKVLANEGKSAIRISPITLEQIEALRLDLSRTGLKFRFDWDADSSTAFLRMPSIEHSLPLAEWVGAVKPDIQRALDDVALCGKHTIMNAGDTQCFMIGDSKMEPDASFRIWDPELGSLGRGERPRVVIESAASQSRADAVRKAWKYLHRTEQEVHAVVVCDVVYPPAKWSGRKTTKLTLDVWVREPTGDPDTDYPLDDCDPPQQGDDASLVEEGDQEPSSPQRSTWSSNDVTQTEDSDRFHSEVLGGPRIWRRNEDTIVVWDEALGDEQNPLPYLELDLYDFLRVCAARPDQDFPVEKRKIFVDLEKFRQTFKAVVNGYRNPRRRSLVRDRQDPAGPPASRAKRSRPAGWGALPVAQP